MSECDHQFEEHAGVRVFNKTGMAWVQVSLLSETYLERQDVVKMQVCTKCGEQGYPVLA